MNLFQYIALPITIILLIWSIIQLISGRLPKAIAILGTIIWLIAGIAILYPDLTIRVAGFLGIGRGADLVLYILAISYIISMFYIYQRLQRMESQITELVRHLALQSATKAPTSDEAKLIESPDIHT